MNIETKWLKDFLSLAKTQSFSRSAEARHITQPAFGRRIRALEDALGCILVDRTSVPVKLTPAGQLFCLTAQNLVQQLDDCVEHLQSLQRRGPEVIDFAVSHTLSLSLFPSFLQSLQDALADVQTRQLVANVDDSVQALKNGICDFLLAFEDQSLRAEAFHALPLEEVQLLPVCRADDAGGPLFNLDDGNTTEVPYLAYPREIFLGRCVTELLAHQPRHLALQQVFESPLADSLKVMALQGMGVAWVPDFSIQQELKQGFLVPCGGSTWQQTLKVYLYRCKRPVSDGAEALWRVLQHRYELPENRNEPQ